MVDGISHGLLNEETEITNLVEILLRNGTCIRLAVLKWLERMEEYLKVFILIEKRPPKSPIQIVHTCI